MNLSQILGNLWHVASSLSLPLLQQARRGVDDALRLDLWDDASPTAAGISMGSLLTFKLSKFNVGSELDIWTYHHKLQRVSILPATALTQPNTRGQNSNANQIRMLEFLHANHGSETKLALKSTQLWNTDTVLHLKIDRSRWSSQLWRSPFLVKLVFKST